MSLDPLLKFNCLMVLAIKVSLPHGRIIAEQSLCESIILPFDPVILPLTLSEV